MMVMDRASIESRLAEAERHVAEGAARIRRQREIHREMVRDHHADAATKAALILKQMNEIQAAFVADRDRLAAELAKHSDAQSR